MTHDLEQTAADALAEGEQAQRAGDLDGALRIYLQLLESDAENAEAHFRIGLIAQRRGQMPEAANHLGRYVQARPDDPRGWTCLGSVLQLVGRRVEAAGCYRRAVQADGDYADAHANLGTVLQGERALEQALASYHEALRREPAHPVALAGVATVLEWQGRYEEGLRLVEAAGAHRQDQVELLLIRARLLRRTDRGAEAVEVLERRLGSGKLPDRMRQRMHFVLGDLYDDAADVPRAFEHYRIANAMKQARFDPEGHAAYTDRVMHTFSVEARGALPDSGCSDERPVFVVGMPRSGSSLLERMLSMHSAIHGAGELRALPQVAGRLQHALGEKYPECVALAQPELLRAQAEQYLNVAAAEAESALRILDKLPLNFEHLGLIQALLPQARIIHCVRDPLDTGLSCYTQNFGAEALPFSYDLTHIGRFYRDYQRLMAHWREVVKLPVLDVHYERLVAEPEPVLREVCAFLGVDWEAACLDFEQHEAPGTTASHAQIRKPVYGSSVGRAQRYRAYLGPLVAALGEDYEPGQDSPK